MDITIISLENAKGVRLGETKAVRRGYARYLIRMQKALRYDKTALDKFAQIKETLEAEQAQQLVDAKQKDQALNNLSIELRSRSADAKRLYGSIGTKEIADAITQAGIPVDKRAIRLLKGPIREVGEHKIVIDLHDQVQATMTIRVVPSS